MLTKRPNMFDKLPLELILEIASSLETDSEIIRFRSLSSGIRDAVECNGHYFWRRLFTKLFDASRFAGLPEHDNSSYMQDYQTRRTWLRNGASFRTGRTMKERRCLEILLDLILDANGGCEVTEKKQQKRRNNISHNIMALMTFAKKENITFNPNLVASVSPLLEVVQLMLAPVMFDLSNMTSIPVTGFVTSQSVAYATVKNRPMILGEIEVDLDWALHQVNFWRHHLLTQGESTLFFEYEDLNSSRRPRFWTEQLRPKRRPELGNRWKASFANVAYVDLPIVRAGNGDNTIDEFSTAPDGSMIIDLALSLDVCGEPGWKEHFEDYLHIFTQPKIDLSSPSKDLPRSLSLGDLHGELIGKGWLMSLPPQEDVPGWQRITFMQHIKDNSGNLTEWICAYEGVVLPGGQIILGRWNVPNDVDEECGPFIMWNLDAVLEDDDMPAEVPSHETDDTATTPYTEDSIMEDGSEGEQEYRPDSEESSSEYEP